MASLFVTATDTGVGKTLITALVVLKLRRLGVDCAFMKPFATGCRWEGGELVSDDVEFLRHATGANDPVELCNPVRLEPPLAPLAVARLTGVSSAAWPDQCFEAFLELGRRHECVVVEGIGGLMVPLAKSPDLFTCRDLASLWHLPLLLVARRSLGTLNHTLLTREVEFNPGPDWRGLAFNDATPLATDDLAAATSPGLLAELTGLPVWAQVPHLEDLSRGTLEEWAERVEISGWNFRPD